MPTRTAILRLDETAGTFTTSHTLFLSLVLQSRNYRLALPILDQIIYNFPRDKSSELDGLPCGRHLDSAGYITAESGLTARVSPAAVHEYYMLGALIYIALSMWEEALLFLELILVSPNVSQANGFMLEAYRKWVLVGCILNGRVRNSSTWPSTLSAH
jgi:COP9 signalosome complex subunit 3